jgi:hypothetical protein
MFDSIKMSLTVPVLRESALRRFEAILDQERSRSLAILTERAGDVGQPIMSAVNGNEQLERKLFVSWRRRKALITTLRCQLIFCAAALVLLFSSAAALPAVLLSDQHWGWKLVEAIPIATVLSVTVFLTWSYCVNDLLDVLRGLKDLFPTSSGVPRQVRDEMSNEASSMLVLGSSAIHCRGGEILLSREGPVDRDIRYEDVCGVMISRDTGALGIMSDKPSFNLVLQEPAEAERIAEGILLKARSLGHHVPSMWIATRYVEDIPGDIPEEVVGRFAASLPAQVFVRPETGSLGRTLVVDMRDALAINLSDRVAQFEGYRVRYVVSAQSTDATRGDRI